jgi:hypothetical protein
MVTDVPSGLSLPAPQETEQISRFSANMQIIRRFLLELILSWKCAMLLKFLSKTRRTYIWNDLNAAKAILRGKYKSLFDKMAALQTKRSLCALEFA